MSYPVLEEPPKNASFWGKGDTITDEQARTLVSLSGGNFSRYIVDKFVFFIKKNWSTRPGKKSGLQLARELDHRCSKEFFNKLSKGDPEHRIPPYNEKIQEMLAVAQELDPKAKKETLNAIDIQLDNLSKYFTEGYTQILKSNLVFENGIPIGVREGDDRKRMSQCHEKLTEDNFARQRIPIAEPQPESHTTGLGRKRRTRRHKKQLRKSRRSRR